MAWDMGFNIKWTQRIEKEERAFITGARLREERERREAKEARRQRRSRAASSRPSQCSTPLSLAGSSSLTSTGMQKSASEAALVPDHWKAAVHFPLVEKDLVTARVKPTADGTVPKISFKPEKVQALWWPGKQHYVKYHPEFSFQAAPEWSPEDILKGYGIRQQHR